MNPDQTNTRPAGPFAITAGEDLTGKRSFLVVLGNSAGTLVGTLPTAVTDLAVTQLCEEGIQGAIIDAEPLITGGPERRIPLKGACNPGEIAVLADPAVAGDKGKVRKLPAVAGVYVQVGVFQEVGVDGQNAKVRPVVGIVRVKSADTITGAADLAALKAATLAILQAQGIVA